MKKLLLALLLAAPLMAQDMPQPPAINEQRELQEIGKLHVQVTVLVEYVGQLQVRIAELEKQIAEAKNEK